MRYLSVGVVSLLGTILLTLVGIPLHCGMLAARIAGVNYLAGALFGFFLAMVTRTRNPWQIYGWLILAGITLWPLWSNWPPGGYADVALPKGAPTGLEVYPMLLRPLTFLIALPYPFAAFGQHEPDQIPDSVPENTKAVEPESGT